MISDVSSEAEGFMFLLLAENRDLNPPVTAYGVDYEIDFGQVRTFSVASLEMRELRAKAAGSIFLSLSGGHGLE